ncbi:MAG: ArsC/Spx/MgsR family protein [Pseudomonadota bacterium]
MADLTLHGLKNCDTCKKAQAALQAAGHTVRFVDIRAETDLTAKVPTWLAAVGAETLVNTRSTTWRGLADAEKSAAKSGGAEPLLIANPTLVKRPVIETGTEIHVGWTKPVQTVLIG